MKRFSQRLTPVVGLFFLLNLLGCATYQSKVQSAREALSRRDFDKALTELKPLAEKENDDQLVYLLDYGVALQVAGKLKESNEIFLKADRLAEMVDYQSVSRIAGSLALNEEMVQYKGDTFEKIFINAYLAMNFLEMGQLDDALVEARRINEKYLKYRADEKKAFELNSFSKYLSAVIWEASRNYDDAYIAYNEAYKIDPTISTIHEDLIRSAKLARRMDTYQSWKKQFPEVKEQSSWYEKNLGELVVIYQQGWGPRKVASPNEYRFPTLMPTYSETQQARVDIEQKSYLSREVYDVQKAAIETLRDDQGILIAKRIGGIATKAVLSDQVRQKNELLGSLTWIALNVADRADVRQWSTLPQTIQMIRIPLAAGKYKFNIEGLNSSGGYTTESLENQEVEIKAGQKKFIVWRSLK
ncbi:COG3014 family protein [Bdellovibrio sp. BCCA]|uniref:COG3014 family protein n=1 Tax=Bdellovibrio sp. BCCA TaxID=3136281 RepID=UPI0030F21825